MLSLYSKRLLHQSFSIRQFFVALLLSSLSAVCVPQATRAGPSCSNGADVPSKYCPYFAVFRPRNQSYDDPRVRSALALKANDTIRSVAIISGISHYPNFEKGDLPSASSDIDSLVNFFRDSQHFDEVIIFRDADVNVENLNYIFEIYLPSIADKYSKTRVVFAYTGHGVPSEGSGTTPYIVLSDARNDGDRENLLSMGQVRQFFNDFAPHGHQFLALINACYGGGVFSGAMSGGNIFKTDVQGANALTAGAPDELVYSLGGNKQGSIFFDSIIDGIVTGNAARSFTQSDSSGNNVTIRRNIVRLGDVLDHVTQDVENINNSKQSHYATPWQGSVMPVPQVSLGGFFFLAGEAQQAPPSAPATAPSGPTSSMPGRPDIKIFNSPAEYSVRGIDVSSYSGKLDWQAISSAKLFHDKIDFAYIRSTMGADRSDANFRINWSNSNGLGLKRGAYHVYDFCDDEIKQADHIRSVAQSLGDQLPIAVDIEYYESSADLWQKKQVKCAQDRGLERVRQSLHRLLSKITADFGKRPLMFGNGDVFSTIVDKSFDTYPIWLHDYTDGRSGTRLAGQNPWTLWQFTNAQKIDGASVPIDASVFFGSKSLFQAFAMSGLNFALADSLNPREGDFLARLTDTIPLGGAASVIRDPSRMLREIFKVH